MDLDKKILNKVNISADSFIKKYDIPDKYKLLINLAMKQASGLTINLISDYLRYKK